MRMIMVIIYDIWGQLPKYFEPGAQHEGRPAAEDLEGGQGDRQGGVTDCQVEKETGGQALFFSFLSFLINIFAVAPLWMDYEGRAAMLRHGFPTFPVSNFRKATTF